MKENNVFFFGTFLQFYNIKLSCESGSALDPDSMSLWSLIPDGAKVAGSRAELRSIRNHNPDYKLPYPYKLHRVTGMPKHNVDRNTRYHKIAKFQ
jgi:hypothetical protein